MTTLPVIKITERTQTNEPILEDEQLYFLQPKVQLLFGADDQGIGTIYCTTKRAVWLSDSDVNVGFSVDFHSIMCHAIARTGSLGEMSTACLYCQLDTEEDVSEMRLVPSNDETDSAVVDKLFKAFSDIAAMNPDPIVEGEGDFFFNEDEVNRGIENLDEKQTKQLERLEGMLTMPTKDELDGLLEASEPGQFEDAEEQGEEEMNESEEGED